MKFRKVTHVLFDLDGTIIDSETVYADAYTVVCAKYGKEFTWDLYAPMQGSQNVGGKICKALDLPINGNEFMKQCLQYAEENLKNVKLLPGALKLIEHLHKHGVPLAVATSSSQQSVNGKMQNHQKLLALFNHITMGASDPDVARGKPDPIIFQVCASRFSDNPNPENCLVIEDAYSGILAAKAANMQVVAVPHSKVDPVQMKDATLVLRSLENFKPELFGLPSYGNS